MQLNTRLHTASLTNGISAGPQASHPQFGNADLAILAHAAEYGLGIGAGAAAGIGVMTAIGFHLKRFFHQLFNVGKPAVSNVAETLKPSVAKLADTLEAVG
jgi:hypothetical protein